MKNRNTTFSWFFPSLLPTAMLRSVHTKRELKMAQVVLVAIHQCRTSWQPSSGHKWVLDGGNFEGGRSVDDSCFTDLNDGLWWLIDGLQTGIWNLIFHASIANGIYKCIFSSVSVTLTLCRRWQFIVCRPPILLVFIIDYIISILCMDIIINYCS